MKKNTPEENTKPTRNYIILAILCLATVLITIYICKWISIYKEDELSSSPLTGKVQEIYLNELAESANEASEAILYFGYTSDRDNYSLEEKILKEVEKRNIQEYVYYINVKDYLENDEYKKIILSTFKDLENKNIKAPLLIYTKRGEIIKIKSSDKKMININDFNNLANILETE